VNREPRVRYNNIASCIFPACSLVNDDFSVTQTIHIALNEMVKVNVEFKRIWKTTAVA
jgi:hypothetical protein